MIWSAIAWTSPLPENPAPAETCIEASVATEETKEPDQRELELYQEGKGLYDAKDFESAIGPWQELYDSVPLCERVPLFVQLGNAHWEAYRTDLNEEHLRQAKAMFERNLEAVTGNEEARHYAQERLDEVETELQRLEDARKRRERAEAERAAIARENARREQEEQKRRQARLDDERRRSGLHVRVGGSVVALGAVSLATSAISMGLGASVDREGARLFDNPNAQPEEFLDLRRRGKTYNRVAIATGALGGALVLSGATVIVVAALRLRKAKHQAHARLGTGQYGLEVRF